MGPVPSLRFCLLLLWWVHNFREPDSQLLLHLSPDSSRAFSEEPDNEVTSAAIDLKHVVLNVSFSNGVFFSRNVEERIGSRAALILSF